MKRVIYFSLLILTMLSGCTKDKRLPNCVAEQLNLQGNVKKVETIVQTTVPLTELFAKSCNPSQLISTFFGNFTSSFDNKGNIKEYIGYGIDGKILFDVTNFDLKNSIGIIPIVVGYTEDFHIDDVAFEKSKNGKIIGAKYMSNNKPIFSMTMSYNEDGNVKWIKKKYDTFSTSSFELKDSTFIKYISYDSHHNWTEAEVFYLGLLSKFNYKFRVKRQITYESEAMKENLISHLKDYNEDAKTTSAPYSFHKVKIGHYGTIDVPDFMNENKYSKKSSAVNISVGAISYIHAYEYKDNSTYAALLISTSPGNGFPDLGTLSREEITFNQEEDQALEEEISASNHIYILKWMHYKFITFKKKRALVCKYYRYAKLSPIPVYVENYIFNTEDGKILSIVYSFQSNSEFQFSKPFQKSVESIKVY